MNLEGSLGAFGLTDLFTLFGMTGKSGALRLSRDIPDGGVHRAVVWFHEGAISGASGDCAVQSLARRVVGGGRVDSAALKGAITRASRDGGVVRALVDAGGLSTPDALDIAEEHTIDSVCDLLRWSDGNFTFNVEEADPDDIGLRLTATALIERARDRQRDWDELGDALPSRTAVLGVPVTPPADPSMRRDEWTLMAMVDGKRTFADLVELAGVGPFAAATTVTAMIRRGLLEVRDGRQEDAGSEVARLIGLLSQLEVRDRRSGARTEPVSPVAKAEPVSKPEPVAPSVSPSAAPSAATSAATSVAPSVAKPEPASTAVPEPVGLAPAYEVPGLMPQVAPPVTVAGTSSTSAASPLSTPSLGAGMVVGSTAMALDAALPAQVPSQAPAKPSQADPEEDITALEAAIHDLAKADPALDRELLVRLIAGVRGL